MLTVFLFFFSHIYHWFGLLCFASVQLFFSVFLFLLTVFFVCYCCIVCNPLFDYLSHSLPLSFPSLILHSFYFYVALYTWFIFFRITYSFTTHFLRRRFWKEDICLHLHPYLYINTSYISYNTYFASKNVITSYSKHSRHNHFNFFLKIQTWIWFFVSDWLCTF